MSHQSGLGAWGIALLGVVATTGCITGEVAPKSDGTGASGGTTTATSGAGRGGANGGATNTGGRNAGAAGTRTAATTAGTSPLSNAGGLNSAIIGGAGGVGSVIAGATSTSAVGSETSSNGGVAGATVSLGSGGSTAVGGAVATGGRVATGGISSIGVGGVTSTGGRSASAIGGTTTGGAVSGGAPTTGGNPSTGGIAATGGAGTAGVAGTTGGPTCSDNVQNGDESAVDCGGACGSTCKPVQACTAAKDCASFVCTNNVCGAYANGCLQLKQRGAPPGKYVIDTDGADYKEPFLAYCPTVGTNLAPVGICQAESGAPPACRSFVGAVGFDFKGVDFGGAMQDAGVLDVGGLPVAGHREVIQLSDDSILATVPAQASANLYHPDGTVTAFGSGLSNPHGVLQLFSGRILITNDGSVGELIFFRDGSAPTRLTLTDAASASQMLTGEVWIPSISTFKIHRFTPDGTAVGTVENPGFASTTIGMGPHGIVQLADGRIVVANSGNAIGGGSIRGRLVFLDFDLSQRAFDATPTGMTKNTDGSLTPPAITGCGNVLQLPNGQILVSAAWDNKIVRLDADGAYVDTYTPVTTQGLYGMTIDHRGRLLAAGSSDARIHVITFPGCSSGTQDSTETDIDCGGPCTQKCGSARKCLQNSDCNSGVCTYNVCDGG